MSQRNVNKYFGRNHFQDNYVKGFQYKNINQYTSLTEWLENVFIAMNENASMMRENGNFASIMDKRLGHTYSLMGMFLTNEKEKSLIESEDECVKFLTDYFNKNHDPYTN